MYISAEGAFAQSERLKVIANNLANIDSTGYKRDVAVFQARRVDQVVDQPPQPVGLAEDRGDLLAVGTRVQLQQLGVPAAQDGTPGQQALPPEGSAERESTGPRDDRLVEVEERRGGGWTR